MAMDQRQTEIRVGEGLQESRINTDFVEFLTKYGSYILFAVILAAGGYVGWEKLQQYRGRHLDEAFSQVDSAIESQSPEALLAVARDQSGYPGVKRIALLTAGDIHLRAARSRLAPGAKLKPDGNAENADDILDDARRDAELKGAEEAFSQALDASRDAGAALMRIDALFGLAAVAECRQDFPSATKHYTQLIETARGAGMTELVAVAESRLGSLDSLKSLPTLYAASQLASPPQLGPPPTLPPSPTDLSVPKPIVIQSPSGPITLEPVAPPNMPILPPGGGAPGGGVPGGGGPGGGGPGSAPTPVPAPVQAPVPVPVPDAPK